MHVNVWAEQLENYEVKLVSKKGFVGLQITFLTNEKILREDNPQLTLWAYSQDHLAALLKSFGAFAEAGKVQSDKD